MSMTDHARPLLVFADDWGRHPSSCQHLVRSLLPNRPVLWVNTIGTRPPRLDRSTLVRALGKLRDWTRPPRVTGEPTQQVANPRVLAPKMWPSFASRVARHINQRLLTRALVPAIAELPQPPIVVTTLPLVADLVGKLPVAHWVYYCVDDFSVWPGYDGTTMQRMERELVPRMDAIISVSTTLVDRMQGYGREAHLLTHGVDLDHWQADVSTEIPQELAHLEGPIVLFWGVIDRRLDLAFVQALAEGMTAGSLVFVGPQEDPDPRLFRLPRVRVLPAMPYARLPALAQAAAVLVMPYADAPVTRAMQPLKLKEYLATGRAVVVRDLPATRPWADCADLASTPEQFLHAVRERLHSGIPESQQLARARLTMESWPAKAQQFAQWLDG